MSDVYFKKTKSDDFSKLSIITRNMLEKIIKDNNLALDKHIPLKVHFGEKGNETYIPAKAYDGIIDFLMSMGIETSFIETNVLYRGNRTTKTSHIELAKEHGFTKAPIIIADGDIGENYYEELINKEFFTKCKIGSEFKKFKQIVVCSHFKGHILAGFGGALKQLAMGFAARGGKLDQHSQMLPTVKADKCIECGKCVEKCDANAIQMNPKAYIDKSLCIGCAGCIAVCPVGAVNHDWGADNFLEKVAEYAYAAALNKENIYINFLSNITKDCDCMGIKMNKITENIGVLISLDSVAIDTASLNLLQEYSNSDLFDIGRKSLEHAEKIGLGSREYKLIYL